MNYGAIVEVTKTYCEDLKKDFEEKHRRKKQFKQKASTQHVLLDAKVFSGRNDRRATKL